MYVNVWDVLELGSGQDKIRCTRKGCDNLRPKVTINDP